MATHDATDPAPRTIEEARALLRRTVRVNTAYRRADQERRRLMAEANALGFTIREIADATGENPGSVGYWVQRERAGVPKQKPGRRDTPDLTNS